MFFGIGHTYLVQVQNCCTGSRTVWLSSLTLLSDSGQFLLPAYIEFFLYCMWAKKAKCFWWKGFFDVCVLDGNFKVSYGLEGCAHCFLKVILIGNFKNRMFVMLQERSGPMQKNILVIFYLKLKFSVHPLLGLDRVRKLVFETGFCSKNWKNSWQEVAGHSGLIMLQEHVATMGTKWFLKPLKVFCGKSFLSPVFVRWNVLFVLSCETSGFGNTPWACSRVETCIESFPSHTTQTNGSHAFLAALTVLHDSVHCS